MEDTHPPEEGLNLKSDMSWLSNETHVAPRMNLCLDEVSAQVPPTLPCPIEGLRKGAIKPKRFRSWPKQNLVRV